MYNEIVGIVINTIFLLSSLLAIIIISIILIIICSISNILLSVSLSLPHLYHLHMRIYKNTKVGNKKGRHAWLSVNLSRGGKLRHLPSLLLFPGFFSFLPDIFLPLFLCVLFPSTENKRMTNGARNPRKAKEKKEGQSEGVGKEVQKEALARVRISLFPRKLY